MAGRFPLYTDADVHGPIVTGLIDRGWDVLRAVDAHPQGTDDEVHFETAAKLGRVLVANDKDQLLIALRWIEEVRRDHTTSSGARRSGGEIGGIER